MNENIRKAGASALEDLCMLAGQPSSGKSRFLNTLIGFDCLPTGTYGTTDVPTYLSRGEDLVLSCADGMEERHTLDEVWDLRKGNRAPDSIRISCRTIAMPAGITFVDMPGINSVDPGRDVQFGEILRKSPVVLYFLGSQISAADRLYLDLVIGAGAKAIVVRTKIDRIHCSEESVQEVVESERSLYMRLFPDIETYFISLEGACSVNELGLLRDYILDRLPDDIRRIRLAKEESYLLAVRGQIAKNQDTIRKNVREKIRTARKILEGRQNLFFDGLELAKENYTELGRRYIQGSKDGPIVKADIEEYMRGLIGGLKKWYRLEMEDGLGQIGLTAGADMGKYDLFDDADIDGMMDLASAHMLFGNISNYYEEDGRAEGYFHTKRDAQKYVEQVMNRFFAELMMDFQDKYGAFITETLQNYARQKEHEARWMLLMVQADGKGTHAAIDGLLEEIAGHGD